MPTPPRSPRIRSAYGPKLKVQTFNDEPSLTKQSFEKECNINNIMARFNTTGLITHYAAHGAHYGDASAQTFTEAMQLIASAQTMFADLPAVARAHFNQDPAQFLEFVNNLDDQTPEGLAKFYELGLTKSKTPPLPTELAPPEQPAQPAETAPEPT